MTGHEGARSRAPSLLLGLVYDEAGERYTPSHTVKAGKRYRYYVARGGLPQQAQAVPRARIPAADLERVVVQRLLRCFGDTLALLDALSTAQDDARVLQALIAAADAQCRAWPRLAPDELRALVGAMIVKITIGTNNIIILVVKRPCAPDCLPAAFIA